MGQIVIALAIGTAIVIGLAVAPLGISRRGGLSLVGAALVALVTTVDLALLAAIAVLSAFAVDAFMARARPIVTRRLTNVLARGVPASLVVETEQRRSGRVRVRQPVGPDFTVEPPEADDTLDATLVARRRGRHAVPPVSTRVDGPLGLASWFRNETDERDVLVYPDLPAARRLAVAVRRGRFRDSGRQTRGPLGLGTEFESIREYLPDDDVRRINWRATQRTGRPMSNQFRVEQDRDVICVVDTGRLMAAPILDRTRLDAALDAVSADRVRRRRARRPRGGPGLRRRRAPQPPPASTRRRGGGARGVRPRAAPRRLRLRAGIPRGRAAASARS